MTKRGTNEWRGSGRYYNTDKSWQAKTNVDQGALDGIGGNAREQRLAQPAVEEGLDAVALDPPASSSSVARRAARSSASSRPAVAPSTARPRRRRGRRRARCSTSRPPIE